MKKSLLLIGVLLLAFSSTLKAQMDETREVFTFGIKAGLNYSNVWDEEGQDFRADGKAGLIGGVFLGIPLGKVLGFQPEILISQKGFKGQGTLFFTPYSFSRTTTYVDVPLMLQIKPAELITFVVGPQYSYLIHQKDVYTFGSNSTEQEEEFENDNVRKNIFGFTMGADVYINHFVLSGRIGWDFLTNHGDGNSSTPRYKNQWLQFTVGYRFYQ